MTTLARTITDDHARTILAPRGLRPDRVSALGVYSVTDPDELPEEFAGGRYVTIPGLVFPWNSPTGGTVLQYRPDEPVLNDSGDPVKYVFPSGTSMVLTMLRDEPSKAGDAPLLIQEGTMQSLAASIYAPDDWMVAGMSGCWSWRKGETQVAIPDLMVAEGRDVVVSLDADAGTNRNVYDAGMSLRDALLAEGASSVKFLRLAGHGAKAGLDDVLGSRPEEKRAPYLARLLAQASEKPADARPSAKKSGDKNSLTAKVTAAANEGRPLLVVNEDRHEVINNMESILRKKWDGTELFDYGNILARRKGASVEPVTDGIFADLISEASVCVTVTGKGDAVPSWPDERSVKAVMARADRFATLDRISRVPFVREDGSIAQTSGYDEATRTFLVLDEAAEAVKVPEEPTAEDVAAALKLWRDEWLGDLMNIMPDEADRANALAMMLTPLIRGLVPLAPLAVVDGLQMGVGKNLVSDCLSILATGKTANPLPYSRDDEENRKVITSSFRAGHELFVFDEAHVIEGRNLARAITGITYSDRILGVSNMIEFPNRITWVALGNNVQVNGDLSRRVYRIRLAPAMANPQDRDSQSFRHPDLKGWTLENRAELLAAGLTLVRAWMTGAREENVNGRRFGSFERWGGMVGGILDNAGVTGFLGNLVEWRAESDYEAGYWTDHMAWLHRSFGTAEFTVSEVVAKMRQKPTDVDHPPKLEDHTATGYNRALGQAYGRVRNRTFSGLQLVRSATTAGHGARWQIIDHRTETPPPAPNVTPPSPETPGTSGSSGSSVSRATRGTSSRPTGGTPARENAKEKGKPMYPMYPNYPSDEGSPLATLLPLLPAVPPRICPDCDGEEKLTPSGLWMACPACHPTSFAPRA